MKSDNCFKMYDSSLNNQRVSRPGNEVISSSLNIITYNLVYPGRS